MFKYLILFFFILSLSLSLKIAKHQKKCSDYKTREVCILKKGRCQWNDENGCFHILKY